MQNVKKFLQEIKVFDTEFTKIRIGAKNDGGYIALKELCKTTKNVYSFGIGDDPSFELDYGSRFPVENIKMFDPTINSVPISDERYEFLKQGAGNGYAPIKDIPMNSLLKMDIEWDEWDALQKIADSNLCSFSQILVEFHMVHSEMKHDMTPYFTNVWEHALGNINNSIYGMYCEVLKRLNADFYIFHIHPNNSLQQIKLGGYIFPPLMEFSFVRKDLVKNARPTNIKMFPVEGLDNRNKTDRAGILCFYPLVKE